MSRALIAALLLVAAPALAQTQQPQGSTMGNAQPSISGPAPTLGQPQAEQNMGNQPANARQVGPSGGTPRTGDTAGAIKPQGPVSGSSGASGQAQGQQVARPSPTQNQSQAQQNQGNNPGNVRELPPDASTPAGPSAGVTKAQGPVGAPASRAQANQPAIGVSR